MATGKGVFKSCLFGCLGLIVFGLLFGGVTAFMAWRSLDDQDFTESDTAPVAIEAFAGRTGAPGRVRLDLSQGEFRILRSEPGEGLRVDTRYDRSAYSLVDSFARAEDGTWTYDLAFHRTMPGLQAVLRVLMGADGENYVHVYLPPDAPVALEVDMEEGGFEGEFGGLWLTEADISFDKGGFNLEVDEPTREPLESLVIRGHMGGFNARGLGNASPHRLSVSCRMGGADVGLGGAWSNDCDADLSIAMGGLSVSLPDNMDIETVGESIEGLELPTPAESEVPRPRMRLQMRQKHGEIDVSGR